jgi:hypothetical protein
MGLLHYISLYFVEEQTEQMFAEVSFIIPQTRNFGGAKRGDAALQPEILRSMGE